MDQCFHSNPSSHIFFIIAQTNSFVQNIVEAEFHLTHPTVSGLLSRLEQKGFIELRTDPEDRRCKRIYVLEKGVRCHELMHKTIGENEQRMLLGFTPEEQELFSDFLQRAIRNMGGDPTPRRFKEDKDQ